ncbi:MAG: hypothetical protein NC079_08880 [Clostridium sp.]|nr:hypothetical protein [Acetatifactor muris]MCM1527766.1 hypothetical protein [Bacteroides sp.]MCM1563704.1 hypothetical protein [Clostridium sp.]
MSTLEQTISMIETLSEPDLIKIQELIRKIFQQRENENVDVAVGRLLKPMSREDFRDDVEIAEKEIFDGRYKNAEEVMAGMEQRYGF